MPHVRKRKQDTVKLELPEHLPVFPLPNVILFPEVEIPLYIFEERYRQMLADSMQTHKMIAISLFKKGWEEAEEPVPSHAVVGVGFIHAAFDNPDGTSYILLKGICRAEIEGYIQMEPYRIAKVKLMPDRIENKAELMKTARTLKKLLIQKLRWVSETPSEPLRFPEKMTDPITLSHVASFLIQADPYLKQDLLETVNSNCRVRHLIELLQEEMLPPESSN